MFVIEALDDCITLSHDHTRSQPLLVSSKMETEVHDTASPHICSFLAICCLASHTPMPISGHSLVLPEVLTTGSVKQRWRKGFCASDSKVFMINAQRFTTSRDRRHGTVGTNRLVGGRSGENNVQKKREPQEAVNCTAMCKYL